MADQEIKTSIDALIAYLNKKGEASTTALSAALGIGETTITDWANVLEKAGMVKITYKSGKMFIAPLAFSADRVDILKKETQLRESNVAAQVYSQVALLNQIDSKIDTYNKTLAQVDESFRTKYKGLKASLDMITNIEGQMNNVYLRIRAKSADTAKMSDELKARLESIQKYATDINTINTDTGNARAISNDVKAKIDLYQQSINSLDANMLSLINNHKKDSAALRLNIKQELKQLEDVLNTERKQMEDYEYAGKQYKQDAAAIAQKTVRERSHLLDDIAKGKQEIDRLSSLTEGELPKLRAKLQELKDQFGSVSKINDNLTAIRKEIADVTVQKEALVKELNSINESVTSLKTQPSSRYRERQETLKKLADKAKKAEDKASKLNSSVTKIEGGMDNIGGE